MPRATNNRQVAVAHPGVLAGRVHPHQCEIWRLHLESVRLIHATFFPDGRLGTDIGLMYVLGAVGARYLETAQFPTDSDRYVFRASKANELASYLGMPRDDVRRDLAQLVRRGLVRRKGQLFAPTKKGA